MCGSRVLCVWKLVAHKNRVVTWCKCSGGGVASLGLLIDLKTYGELRIKNLKSFHVFILDLTSILNAESSASKTQCCVDDFLWL